MSQAQDDGGRAPVPREAVAAHLSLSVGSDQERAVQAARLWFELSLERLLGAPGRLARGASPAEIDWFSREPFAWRVGVAWWICDHESWVETYSAEAWAGLLDQLAKLPRTASLEIERNDGRGRRGGPSVSVTMRHRDGWLELVTEVDDEVASSVSGQRDLLATVREVAEVSNPSAGGVYLMEGMLGTALEGLLNRSDGLQTSRQVLRDYGWITVLAEELGDRLGGLPALRASGALVEVERLAAGGYWLLAAPAWDEYGWPQAWQLFDVLAPVLPPGRPRTLQERVMVMGEAPQIWKTRNLIVDLDPRDVESS